MLNRPTRRDLVHILRFARIPAAQVVIAQYPRIPRLRHRRIRRLRNLVINHPVIRRFGPVDQFGPPETGVLINESNSIRQR